MSPRLLALALLALPSTLGAQDTGWTIDRFHAEYTIRPDRKIDVVERIEVDFGALSRHGIYRVIPVRYRRLATPGTRIEAGREIVDIDVDRVEDEGGNRRQVKITREGDDRRIRIGDPDRTVSGRQTYVIHYTLERGIGFFEEHDELYWQVTGTGWPVPITRASAAVTLPISSIGASPTDGWGAWCYTGWSGSGDQSRCTARYEGNGRYEFTTLDLDPGEGLTFVAAFPKGVIAPPPASERWLAWLVRLGPLVLPLFVIGFMTQWWARRGRDPDAGSVVPMWDVPEGIRPATAGALVDQRVDMRDVVATVIDLAARGHLEIREVVTVEALENLDPNSFLGRTLRVLGIDQTDWELVKRDGGDRLLTFESLVLGALFEGAQTRRLSDLHHDFYKHLPPIHDAIYRRLEEHGHFVKSPNKTRSLYRWIGGAIIVAGIGLGAALSHMPLLVGIVGSGLIVFGFAGAMPASTLAGARMRRHFRGVEEYIRRAEKAELEFRNAPEKTPALFEKLLPYAIALDVSDIWIKQFDALFTEPPSWYATGQGVWSGDSFSRGLTGFQTAATRTLGSSPGSSSGGGGGGSVGGGGGGGGGGSW